MIVTQKELRDRFARSAYRLHTLSKKKAPDALLATEIAVLLKLGLSLFPTLLNRLLKTILQKPVFLHNGVDAEATAQGLYSSPDNN